MERRIRLIVKAWIQAEECGLCPSCGTQDQLGTLHRVLDGSWEFGQQVNMCFVDLKKAFNCVLRGILSGVLHDHGDRGPLFRAVRFLYYQNRSFVHFAGNKLHGW